MWDYQLSYNQDNYTSNNHGKENIKKIDEPFNNAFYK